MSEDKEKFRKILDYWMEHNTEHGEEFREWAEKAEQMAGTVAKQQMLAAAEQMEKANRNLAEVLEILENTQ